MAHQPRSSSKSHRFGLRLQRGIALILYVFLLGLLVTSVTLAFFGGSLKILHNTDSANVLAKVRAEIVGSVIRGEFGTSYGVFPCPEDTTSIGTSNEGQVSPACSNTATSIGRFAWRSLNTGELKDGSTSYLWYALSPSFRQAPINSDSVAGLSLNASQNQAIAIIFSPNHTLSGQQRPIPTPSSPPDVSHYLEGENADNDADFITEKLSDTFNDQLLTVSSDDVFPSLEKRVLGEFKNYLLAYKATWGTFPYPATFGNPISASYIGSTSTNGGFLPISNVSPSNTWSTAPVPEITSPVGNTVSAPSCSLRTSNTIVRCDISVSSYNASNPPTVKVTGVVNGIGLGFYDGLSTTSTSDIRVSTRSGTATITNKSFSNSLNASGQGLVSFSGTLNNTGIVRVQFMRTPPLSNWVLAATNQNLLQYNVATKKGNNWHHLIYYKVASSFLPGGSSTCGVCLTVNKIDTTPNTSQTTVHALLMSAGRRLEATDVVANPAQQRPASTTANYFDSVNNIASGLTFDSVSRPQTTFNDQIEIVE